MDTRNDLIPLNAQPLAKVFDDPEAMGRVLTTIEKAALAETADPTTEDGRASIKSLAYKIARSKTALEDVGKPLADAARVKYDAINAIRKTAKDRLNALRDGVRQPVNDWEDAEKERIGALEDRLTAITALREYDRTVNPEHIDAALARLKANEIGDDWQEFADRAAQEVVASLDHLIRLQGEVREAAEREAELEALRAEKLEREAADAERQREAAIAEREKTAAENARKQAEIDAENALEREKDRAAREVQEAENRAAAAKREAADAARHERERIEAEREADEAERRKREANDAHRHDRQETIFKALTRAPVNLSEGDATRVVGAVADKLIPFLHIEY